MRRESYLFIIPITSNVSVTSSEINAGMRRLKLEDPELKKNYQDLYF